VCRKVALKVAAAVALEAVASRVASRTEEQGAGLFKQGIGREAKLKDIEMHLEQLQYDPLRGVSV